MSELKALLFDVDGTLAETEEVHREAFNHLFAEYGLDWVWDRDLYRELLAVTGGKERIRHYIERYHPEFRPPKDLDSFIAELHAAKTRKYGEIIASGRVPLRPGVRRLLEEARAEGLRLGITTTTSPDNVRVLLETSLSPESLDWFEVIAAGSVVPNKKPAPDIYLYALEQMGLEPGACLAIEDSYNGVRAALGAGIPVLVTASAYTEGEDFNGAALVVDQLGEPGQPFRVLSGEAGGAQWVTPALLREVHARSLAGQ